MKKVFDTPIVLLFFLYIMLSPPIIMASDAALQKAHEAIEKKEFNTAIIHLKNLLQKQPKNSEARQLLGSTYLTTGDNTAALKELSKAYQLMPNSDETILLYAEALLKSGKNSKVQSLLSNDATISPEKDYQRLAFLAMSYLGANQISDARETFQQSINQQANAKAYNGLAIIGLLENDLKTAKKMLDKSTALEANNPETLHIQAKLDTENKRYDAALKLYSQLLDNDSGNISLLIERSQILIDTNDVEQAESDLNKIIAAVPIIRKPIIFWRN